ncbi:MULTISPECIES: Gfo/Idh/MocA family protein [Alphaproteobacteria]|uniref:D-galactose 1-dehydrogenase n=2 Tax=Alphaproteobacteria TaxID=28211 RepID=A0A512HKE8_9HYPH|nr:MULTISPECIES: Gfo/Idh/MocA family oxidoreductase [Alphaproteobacteria]GEO85890.1 D-galactose 1-dehydrogenase [Ciceribacter naphthalenivorans]GLR21746.1 D-galactose 1-dehydrogenase [Ciceribacter naphthalenivorans]GLT04602.1 D-galactose 1-dehydrogenase [Sphingomonas psychrolutea]
MTDRISLALVGIGKIARDQHIPSVAAGADFDLKAAVSRHGKVEGIENHEDFDAFLASRPAIRAVSLCTPPEVRFDMARKAIAAGHDVLMEKPPATTLGEAEALAELAAKAGVTLFATWHSRFALGVEPAKTWLAGRAIRSISIVWKEDVRRWHPGQAWIWEPGGFGVFDPGINALSILTAIVPGRILVENARLSFPANRRQPIAAEIAMRTFSGAPIVAEFDWRQEGPQTWDITVQTDQSTLRLSSGGAELFIDGIEKSAGPDREYAGIYERFATLIRARESDVDFQPLRLVADAFLCGERLEVEAFED